MTARLIALVLILGILPSLAFAQNRPPAIQRSISGLVVDATTDNPIATATVGLWSAGDSSLVTGTITEESGRFRIEGIRGGAYYVSISFVGYASERISDVVIGPPNREIDLGTIALTPDTQMLDEVRVSGERATVQFQIDRTVYNTADSPVAVGGTATNVLETIPSIDVDVEGNISLRGSGNVAVLINGRPAPVTAEYIATYLRQIPSGSIERVEVIPNPSARFDPEGMGGIINIVLKEEAELGLGGTVIAGGDSQGGYNASGTFTYGRGPLNLALMYGFRQEEGFGGGTSFRINRYATPLTYFDQIEDEEESETSHLLNVSGDYQLSAKTSLNGSAQLGIRNELEKEFTDFRELDASLDPRFNFQRLMSEGDDGWNTDLRLGLTHSFSGVNTRRAGGGMPQGGFRGRHGGWRGRGGSDGPSSSGGGNNGHILSVEARYDGSANEGEELFTENVAGGGELRERQNAFTDRNHKEASLQVDYVRPIGGFRLEAGYKGDRESMYSDLYSESAEGSGPLTPDVGLINTFDYDQNIHALYAQLARQWGPIGAQVGLRAEMARTTFMLQNTNEAYDNDYNSLFPSAFLTYKASEATLFKASYSRRIHRPRTWSLNPFPSFDDPLNIRMGNPALKPEYIDAFELGYVQFTPWGSITLTPYYRRTTDVIRFFQQLREDGVTVRTSGNFDTSSSSGVELITSLDAAALIDGLRGYVSIEGFRTVTDGSNIDTAFQNNAFGWGGRLNASYNIGDLFGVGDIDLQATVRYRAPMDTEQGRMGSFSWTDVALRQALFGERASLTFRARDVLGTAGFSNIIDQPDLYNEFSREFGAQAVGVTFTYSFGKEQQQNRRDERPDEGGGMDQMEMD